MKKILSTIFLLPVLGLSPSFVKAQDAHFSQFYENAILRNPSLIGIYSEDYKISGQYRNQWSSVGRGFRTGVFNAEVRFPINRNANDFLSVGFLFYSDKAGRIDFKTVGWYPAVNFNKSLEDDHNTYLSLGFTGGRITRTIDVTKMTFDNQYQNGGFNPDNGSGESELPNPKLGHWDLGTGISVNSSPSEHTSYYIGIAAYHFTSPKRSFYSDQEKVRLQTRWSANAGFSWFINEEYSLLTHGNYQIQGPNKEIIAGGMIRWSRTTYSNPRAFGISAGAFYRFGDAIIPMLKLDWKGQTFAFSYDVNNSSLKDATGMRGGMEVTIFTSGLINASPEDKRICPRF